MTEATAAATALAAQGVTPANLDANTDPNAAPKAPVDNGNTPPPKEGRDEEHGTPKPAEQQTPEQKAAADAASKEAADKAAREKLEAEGPLRVYITLSDPAGQAAINLLKESGLGPNEANRYFAKAIESGDLADIDVAGLEARIGKDKATLVMAGVTAHYTNEASKVNETVQKTFELFGGQQNWNTVKTWAQTAEKGDLNLKAQIDSIRSMLDEGGLRAELGAKELLRLYNASPTTKGLGNNKLAIGDSTGAVVGTALSRSDYLAALKEAHARGAKPAEIKALDARRMAGKASGI